MSSLIEAILRDAARKRAPHTLEYLDSEAGKKLLAKVKDGMSLFARAFSSPQKQLLSKIREHVNSQPGLPAALSKTVDDVRDEVGSFINGTRTSPLESGPCHLTIRARVRSSAYSPMTSRLKKIKGVEDAFKDLPSEFKQAFYDDMASKLEDDIFAQALKNRPQKLGPVWISGADNNPTQTWGDAGSGCYYWSWLPTKPSEYQQERRAIEVKIANMGAAGRGSWAKGQTGYPW